MKLVKLSMGARDAVGRASTVAVFINPDLVAYIKENATTPGATTIYFKDGLLLEVKEDVITAQKTLTLGD